MIKLQHPLIVLLLLVKDACAVSQGPVRRQAFSGKVAPNDIHTMSPIDSLPKSASSIVREAKLSGQVSLAVDDSMPKPASSIVREAKKSGRQRSGQVAADGSIKMSHEQIESKTESAPSIVREEKRSGKVAADGSIEMSRDLGEAMPRPAPSVVREAKKRKHKLIDATRSTPILDTSANAGGDGQRHAAGPSVESAQTSVYEHAKTALPNVASLRTLEELTLRQTGNRTSGKAESQGRVAGTAEGFCMKGKQLPELYLLGMQKGASTSLARDLVQAGVHVALMPSPTDASRLRWWQECWNCGWKESHFWEREVIGHSVEAGARRQLFLQHLPRCVDNGDQIMRFRRIVADMTPDNLMFVPVPPGTKVSSHHGNPLLVPVTDGSFSLPQVLNETYGGALSGFLKFVITVRDPLHRMHSAYHHSASSNFTHVCRDCRAPTFKEALAASLAEAEKSPPNYHDWFWASLIDLHLPEWLKFFHAKQFLVAPFETLVQNGGIQPVCRAIGQMLKVPISCHSQLSHKNKHVHLTIEEEQLEPDLLERLHAVFDPHRQQLKEILGRMYVDGTELAGYEGAFANVEGWTDSWWNATIFRHA